MRASVVAVAAAVVVGCGGARTQVEGPALQGVDAAVSDAGTASVDAAEEPGTGTGTGTETEEGMPIFEAEPRPGVIEDPTGQAMLPFFEGLLAAERGEADGRVVVAQFGDSHTAGDALTGRLRRVLQGRFGDAGRGFVLAGRPPIRHYHQNDLTYGSAPGWHAEQGGKRRAQEPLGLGQVRVSAERTSALAWVGACAGCEAGRGVETFEIFYERSFYGGALAFRIDDGDWRALSTRAEPDEEGAALLGYEKTRVADGAHTIALRPGGGGLIGIFGVAMERERPGVIVEGLGIVGLQLGHLHGFDWDIIGAHLGHRAPRLVILQYGTNEADARELDLAAYERKWTEVIARVRAAAPGASILILGPPDMGVRELGKRCDRRKKPRRGCEWKTPPTLAPIVEVERRVARRAGVAFFDSFAAMGGANQMAVLRAADPPLVAKDHVHFTTRGYERWADLLLADLLARYDAWRARQPRPPRQPSARR